MFPHNTIKGVGMPVEDRLQRSDVTQRRTDPGLGQRQDLVLVVMGQCVAN